MRPSSQNPERLHTRAASGSAQRRNTRPQVRGGGFWEPAPGSSPRPAPPLLATPRPSHPLPGAGPAPRSFKAACGRRRACFAPSDAAEVAASPLRRRGDCWEGRRDGGGGTCSRRPVRLKRGGSRSRSGSRARAGGGPEQEAQVREGRLGRETRLWVRPRGGVVTGAACARAAPTLAEGARSWVAGGGSSAFSGGAAAGRLAGLLGGSSWAGPRVTENPRSQLLERKGLPRVA